MDKYEYRIKAEQIRKLAEQEDFVSAMKIANTIDWNRVRSIPMLCLVGEIYEKNDMLEESRDVMLIAYDRHPYGRMIIYSLAELSIRLEDYIDAVEYYKEFVQVAPRDTGRYILQYKLYEAQHVGIQERIAVLEEFKRHEYIEKWAFELAYLYHRADMGEKCVSECDELILWFSEGKYVEKAIELKMLHAPLTKDQQEKYESRNDVQIEKSIAAVEAVAEKVPEEEAEIEVKTLNYGIYDTVNLQKELAKSMEQILDVTQKETVEPVAEHAKKSDGESPADVLLEGTQNETLAEEVQSTTEEISAQDEEVVANAAKLMGMITGNDKGLEQPQENVHKEEPEDISRYETQEELGKTKVIGFDINDAPTKIIPVKEIQRVLEEQEEEKEIQEEQIPVNVEQSPISMSAQEKEIIEKQSTSQMSIEEVLQEWERIKAEKQDSEEDTEIGKETPLQSVVGSKPIFEDIKEELIEEESGLDIEEIALDTDSIELEVVDDSEEGLAQGNTSDDEILAVLKAMRENTETTQAEKEEISADDEILEALKTVETTSEEEEEVQKENQEEFLEEIDEIQEKLEVVLEEARGVWEEEPEELFEEVDEIQEGLEVVLEEAQEAWKEEPAEILEAFEEVLEETAEVPETSEEILEGTAEVPEASEEVLEKNEIQEDEFLEEAEELLREIGGLQKEEPKEMLEEDSEEVLEEAEELLRELRGLQKREPKEFFEEPEEVLEEAEELLKELRAVQKEEPEAVLEEIEEFTEEPEEATEEPDVVEEEEPEEFTEEPEETEEESDVVEEEEPEEYTEEPEEFAEESDVIEEEEPEEITEEPEEFAEESDVIEEEESEGYAEETEDVLEEAEELLKELAGYQKAEPEDFMEETEDVLDEAEELLKALGGYQKAEPKDFIEETDVVEEDEVEGYTEETEEVLGEAEELLKELGSYQKAEPENFMDEPEMVEGEPDFEEEAKETSKKLGLFQKAVGLFKEQTSEEEQDFEEEQHVEEDESTELEYEVEDTCEEYEMVEDESEECEFEFEDLEEAIMRQAQSALLEMSKAKEAEAIHNTMAEEEEYYGEAEADAYWAQGYEEAQALEGYNHSEEVCEEESYTDKLEEETYAEETEEESYADELEEEIYAEETEEESYADELEEETYAEETEEESYADELEEETYAEETEEESYADELEEETYTEETEEESYADELEEETYTEETEEESYADELEEETYTEEAEEESYTDELEEETYADELEEETYAEETEEESYTEALEEAQESTYTEESSEEDIDEYSAKLYGREETEESQEPEEESGDLVEELESKLVASLPEGIESISGQEDDIEEDEPIVLDANAESFKKIFKYFTEVNGVSEQILDALESIDEISDKGNVIIMGDAATGKTTLAVDIIKAAKKSKNITGNKVARITGEVMNNKDMDQIIESSIGGVLIVEEAAAMTADTVDKFSRALDETEEKLLVILEDSKERMLLLLEMNRSFREKFTAIIDLPPYTNTDLVSFAKSYAKEKQCTIDEMGILALYSKLAEMQFETDFIPTLYHVKDLVDEAIGKAEKRKIKGTFSRFLSRKKETESGTIIKEKDFI